MKLSKTTQKTLDKIISLAESDGWCVRVHEQGNDLCFLFSRFSTFGQDFNTEILYPKQSLSKNFINSLYDNYCNYDPSAEAMLWLDETGHGKNGAPYEMQDVLKDMIECEQMLNDLYLLMLNNL